MSFSIDPRKKPESRRLTERIADGDADAIREAYDAFAPAVYRRALTVVRSESDAEDVLQEVFLKLIQVRPRQVRDLKVYLLVAARNEAISLLRRRFHESPGIEAFEDLIPARLPAPAGDHDLLHEALDALPPEQREVVYLKVFEEMSLKEIGQVVQAPINTVASRYRYALDKLRRALGGCPHVR